MGDVLGGDSVTVKVAGVVPVGFVADLTSAYRECAFTVAPIFSGGGTNIKVLESLAFGRACVLTEHAHRGYQKTLRHLESVYVAKSAAEMTAGCVELLGKPALCETMGKQGAGIVSEHFSFEAFSKVVEATVLQVLGAGSRNAASAT